MGGCWDLVSTPPTPFFSGGEIYSLHDEAVSGERELTLE